MKTPHFWCFSLPAYWPLEYLVCKSGRGYTNLKNSNDLSPNLEEKERQNVNGTWQQYHWRYVFPADAKIKARAWACHQLNVLGEPKQCQKVITNSNLKTIRKLFDDISNKVNIIIKGQFATSGARRSKPRLCTGRGQSPKGECWRCEENY